MRWTRWLSRFVSRWPAARLGCHSPRRRCGARTAPLSFERLEDRTLLATLTVNSVADNTTADAFLTLAEAFAVIEDGDVSDGVLFLGNRMLTAGELAQLNQSPALGTNDTIRFAASTNGTEFDLVSGQFFVVKDVKLQGNGASQTILDAQLGSRFFSVTGADVDLTLEGLTLKNGRAAQDGGAILSMATGTTAITITDCVLTGNSTTGDSNEGGAIYSANSTVTVTRSTLNGNSTTGNGAEGGAVFALNDAATVTVVSSTLSGNSTAGTNSEGGAIASFYAGDVAIINSTLSGNQVNGSSSYGGGAIYADDGDVTIVNSTITNNSASKGGGIGIRDDNVGESLTIHNSIIAGNTATTNPDFTAPGDPGTNLLVTWSLIGRNDGTTLAASLVASGANNFNFVGGSAGAGLTAAQIGLAALANNGGTTQTHALLSTSLALNSGINTRATIDGQVGSAALTSDQRGAPFQRVFNTGSGGGVDMGAFESQALRTIVGGTAYFVGENGINDSFTYNTATRVVRYFTEQAYVLPASINLVAFDGLTGRDVLTLLGTTGSNTAQVGQGTVNFEHNSGHVGFDVQGVNLETIILHGQGGNDVVTLTGSTGNDTFFARPTSGVMVNGTYDLEVFNFAQITGNLLSGAGDLAQFFTSTGTDTITASPGTASISSAGISRTANGFDTLLMIGTAAGADTAYLMGSTGNDGLNGGLGSAAFSGTGFNYQMQSIEFVNANGLGGLDIARYTGSAGSDIFTAAPTTSSIAGAGYRIGVSQFERHFATGGAAADVADLTDSTGNDTFLGSGPIGTLSGTGFLQQCTSGFETVRIRGVNGGTNTRTTSLLGYTLQQIGTWV